MKNILKKIWKKITELFKNPIDLLIPFLFAEIVFWIPVWLPALLGVLISPWWFSAATAVILFWAGPFTPALLLQIIFIGFCTRVWKKIRKKRGKKND